MLIGKTLSANASDNYHPPVVVLEQQQAMQPALAKIFLHHSVSNENNCSMLIPYLRAPLSSPLCVQR